MNFLKAVKCLFELIGFGTLSYIDWRIAVAIALIVFAEFLDHELRR